jgi:hypothetical protein
MTPTRFVGDAVGVVQGDIIPAWRRAYEGELAAPVLVSMAVAAVLQALLPNRIVEPVRWLFPIAAGLLVIVLVVGHEKRIGARPRPLLRLATLVLLLVLTIANASAGARLIIDLFRGTGLHHADDLILAGGAIWLTNVIIFALVYWLFDRGGPAARAGGMPIAPDFLFPQMTLDPSAIGRQEWHPEYVDYLYTSFTNATAFSPTDTMPMTQRAKLMMMLQSSVALLLAILVVARAVNVLK